MPVYRLSQELMFPSPDLAVAEGLLAVGGDLSEKRLLLAYALGIFPWYTDDEPILWWSPDPRMVLYPAELHVSRRLRRILRKGGFDVTMDRAFPDVIRACAAARGPGREDTWIVEDMSAAYCRLHESGFAHSVETWRQGELVGGVYGVSLGGCFFGESMFTRTDNASKVALVHLVHQLRRWNFDLLDCQVATTHMRRFGAREIPRTRFLEELHRALRAPTRRGTWHLTAPPDL